jgi:hypothetical protein
MQPYAYIQVVDKIWFWEGLQRRSGVPGEITTLDGDDDRNVLVSSFGSVENPRPVVSYDDE